MDYAIYFAGVLSGVVLVALWQRYARDGKASAAAPRHSGTVLDTSVMLDARFSALVESGAINQPLLVPSRVQAELAQFIASKSEKYKAQGQRAQEVLKQMRTYTIQIDDEFDDQDADEQAVLLAVKHSFQLATLDKEIVEHARQLRVPTLNPDELFTAMQPRFVRGSEYEVKLMPPLSKGDAYAQLPHNSVMVVKGAAASKGVRTKVQVLHTQTKTSGRVIIARKK